MIPRYTFSKLAEILIEGGAKRATKYVSDSLIVKATLRSKSRNHKELLFTIGRPNYLERRFIAACRAAGERFPVKKIQIKWPKGK